MLRIMVIIISAMIEILRAFNMPVSVTNDLCAHITFCKFS